MYTFPLIRRLTLLVILVPLGCFLSAQTSYILQVNQAAQLVSDAGTDQTICPWDTFALGGNPTANNGTAPYSFSWAPSTGMADPTEANPNTSPGVTTVYSVTITDSNGCTSMDTMTLTVDTCVGIGEQNWTSELNIFPNPSAGDLTLSFEVNDVAKNVKLQVITARGKKILERELGNIQGKVETLVDLKNVAVGIYFVKLQSEGKQIIRKIVIE